MRYALRWLVLLFCIMILTSCWDRQELNEIAIVVGMGVDKIDDEILLSVQIVNPGNVAAQTAGSLESAPVITYTQRGKSIFEAIRKLTKLSSRKLYYSHLRIVVFSEQVAKEGISPLLDLLARDHELRTDYYVLISRNTEAQHILEVTTLMDRIPANKLFASLETSHRAWAATGKVTIDRLIELIALEGDEAVLTGIIVKGDIKKGETMENTHRLALRTLLQYDGMAFFKKDKLVGWLDEDASKVYNYIKNNVISSVGVYACPEQEGEMTVEVTGAKSRVKGMVRNNQPKVKVSLNIEVNVGELECSMDLTQEHTLQQIELTLEESFKKVVEDTIAEMQTKYQIDIFGFGQAIHRANPSYWLEHKEEWSELFAKLDVQVDMDFHVRAIGGFNRSVPMQKEE